MFLTLSQLCEERWFCFSVCCKDGVEVQGDMNLALRENSKEPLSSTISTETSFSDDSNEETLNLNKVCQQ